MKSFILTLFASFALLAACSFAPHLTGISASVVAVKLNEHTAGEAKLLVTVRYANENIIPVGIVHSAHKLYLNSVFIGRGVSNEAIGLPPTSEATQDFVVKVENAGLAAKLPEMLSSAQLKYRLESEFTIPNFGEERRLKFVKEGRVEK